MTVKRNLVGQTLLSTSLCFIAALHASVSSDYYFFSKSAKGHNPRLAATPKPPPPSAAQRLAKRYNIKNNGYLISDNYSFVHDPETGNIVSVAKIKEELSSQQMQSRGGYSSDPAGNVTSDPQGRIYEYDAEDRLIHVTGPGLDVSYDYDADGLRIAKRNNLTGETTLFLWDTNNPTGYPQVVEELDGNKKVKTRYAYGLHLISRTDINGASYTTRYYHCDAGGNVRMLTDEQGNATDTYDYDAFGTLVRKTGSTPNNYLFHGEYYDADIAMYYLRARHLKPEIGRFASMDPDEGSRQKPTTHHKYTYSANDPINKSDPSGMYFTLGQTAVGMLSAGVLGGMTYLLWPNPAEMQLICNYPGGFKAYLRGIDEIMFPPGINVDDNIRAANRMTRAAWMWNVWPGREWDFKKNYDNPAGKMGGRLSQYEKAANLGNFNYGATGLLVGFNRSVMRRGAGLVEIGKDIWRERLISGPGYGLLSPPFGDDPQDQVWIKKGFSYINDWWVIK